MYIKRRALAEVCALRVLVMQIRIQIMRFNVRTVSCSSSWHCSCVCDLC